MTDKDLVLKKLAFVETCVEQLRSIAKPALFERDIKERRFVEHTLQLCIQATQDVAAHIVADARLGEPATNRELFTLLAGAGWISESLAETLRAAVSFRNVLVHGYVDVDIEILRDVFTYRLGDLLDFAECVRRRIQDDQK